MKKMTNEFSEFVLFSEEEIRALDERSFEKEMRGKPATCITCLVRDRPVLLKPEERTRQLWLSRLSNQYGYPASRIAVEYPITFGRDTSNRADIVLFDDDRPTVPYIIIEVKSSRSCATEKTTPLLRPCHWRTVGYVEQRNSGRSLASQES